MTATLLSILLKVEAHTTPVTVVLFAGMFIFPFVYGAVFNRKLGGNNP